MLGKVALYGFAMRYRKDLELRCFEYAALLVMCFRVPVLTTVVLVEKSGPREVAYQEVLGSRVVHERRFDVVRLWEVDPERALRLGPGAAALVGLAEKTTLRLMRRAARKIQRETEGVLQSGLLFILLALGPRRYTAGELAGVIPKETVMAGSLWAEAAREGRIEGARELCLDLARQHHPGVADRAVRLIEACSDVKRLHEWALQAHQLSDSAFLNLLTEPSGSTSGPRARRAPRPSRKGRANRSA